MRITPQDLSLTLQRLAPEAECLARKLPEHVEGEVLVKLSDGAGPEDLVDRFGAQVLEEVHFPADMAARFGGRLVHLRLPEGMTTPQGIALLEKQAHVAYAESNDVVHTTREPNDLNPALWGLKTMGAPQAWDLTTGKREGGPLIAVVDTGVDYTHPDLVGNIWNNPNEVADGKDNDGNGVIDDLHGYSAIKGSGDPMDENHHGTHVAGTIAAEGNNGLGVVGVNWQARVLGCKFMGADGSGTTANAIKAISYADGRGARVVNHSWGSQGGWGNQSLKDAIASSRALHLAAAGNDGQNIDQKPFYPAAYDLPNLISVAATDSNDQLASFSNYGVTAVDLAAPGVSIYSTLPGGQYGNLDGTSMATPQVTGTAALILSAYPNATNEEIRGRLLCSVDPVPSLQGMVATGGRLNAARAIEDDRIAPASLGALQASAQRTGDIDLRWKATGDDGTVGKASQYVLKSGDSPVTEQNFEKTPAVAIPAPQPAGQAEQASLLVFPSKQERTLHFGLKAVDNVGHPSPLSTTSVRVPAANVTFEDSMDGLFNGWSGQGWGRVSVEGRGKVWTDSPDGPYEAAANRSLTSADIDLSSSKGSSLTFDYRHDLENNFDKVTLEATSNAGQSWAPLKEFSGSSGWSRRRLDLSNYDGQKIRLRFRLTSDNAVQRDGFYLDTLTIAGNR